MGVQLKYIPKKILDLELTPSARLCDDRLIQMANAMGMEGAKESMDSSQCK